MQFKRHINKFGPLSSSTLDLSMQTLKLKLKLTNGCPTTINYKNTANERTQDKKRTERNWKKFPGKEYSAKVTMQYRRPEVNCANIYANCDDSLMLKTSLTALII